MGVDAKKRLEVLQSLDDLGVGFRLAMQDMEIRGAGNLLGKDQSGQVDLVGFELYSRVLKDAVKELQRRKAGEVSEIPNRPEVDPDVSIGFPAHIPTFYIPDVSERLILYQRMVALESEAEGREMLEEIEDRFGNPPQEVVILIELMIFRSELKRLGIVSAIYRNGGLSLAFHPQLRLPIEKIVNFAQRNPARLRLSPTMGITIRVPVEEVSTPANLLGEMREVLGGCGI